MWTQTIVQLAAGASTTLIAANPRRQRLRWMVTGLGSVTIAPGDSAVVLGRGLVYSGAGSIGEQGGGEEFQLDTSRGSFSAIANADTTVVIWEYVQNVGVALS